MKIRPKAVVAMSGGVDSSVAAALMKEDGYDVTGIMLKLWKGAAANNESGCCSVDAAEDARRVAQVIDIPFYVLNFADQFSERVIDHFTGEYSRGRTPNPCIECNRSVKFNALLERAGAYGSETLATGHYARLSQTEGRINLLRGKDRSKDQSYVLYMLGQHELTRARFPVGEYSKPEIRNIAASLGLRVADKPESQDICFVPSGDSHAFIKERVAVGSRPGPILTSDGNRLGEHQGFAHYTVGQRRGLGVGVGVPLYVREIRPDDNSIVVATEEEMHVAEVQLSGVNMVSGLTEGSFAAEVMTRYRGAEASARVNLGNGKASVHFDTSQPPPAPGQAAVFYKGDEVLGGGTIDRATTHEPELPPKKKPYE